MLARKQVNIITHAMQGFIVETKKCFYEKFLHVILKHNFQIISHSRKYVITQIGSKNLIKDFRSMKIYAMIANQIVYSISENAQSSVINSIFSFVVNIEIK